MSWLKTEKELREKKLLTIELVPQSCWYSNVRSEVSSRDWVFLKKQTALAAGNKCEICGGRGPKWPVECHEVWHYDDKNLIQKLERLIALCPDCHMVKHIGLAQIKGNGNIAKAHLMKVNGWNDQDAKDYIDSSFAVWRLRSTREWKLDISYLDTYGFSK